MARRLSKAFDQNVIRTSRWLLGSGQTPEFRLPLIRISTSHANRSARRFRDGSHGMPGVRYEAMRVAVYAWVSIAAVLAAAVGPGLAPDVARADPPGAHTITYIAKVDAPISSGRAIYMVNDTYTATAPLSATGREFTTTTMLADPAKAGMQVSIPWPYSGNVHCEIDVDNHIVAQVDQFVASTPGNGDPNSYGVVSCGAGSLPVPLWWAKICDAWWCTDTSLPSNARDQARADVTRDSDLGRSPSWPPPDPNEPAT
ncbi:hypothetical protein DSM43518_00521 [Mycobacterium marinum]|uniref:Uncharacterized protein n=3 Tax=Mycobacterium TaxID=1763 RepID=A0A3E2MZF5_MYCMR|nr:hypothetical protein MM1218R_01635 [Mycobacterium marinum]RFZ12296.1 hypothetical protein DE4381_00837 [Mycobacterium marinum]RFZ14924.1 hypothetical protein DSM43518_00521 [Mycobacterium marinum]RFZ38861.1 hypothetical protein KST_02652 [Mycobacterium marinum]RFZ45089.1 hypothetical protein DAVIS_01291 [Mycobacterium marinum]